MIGKRQEALTLIEAAGRLILGINDNGERRDLTTNRAEQSVREQEAAIASPLIILIDGEPAQKRRRNEWIARQLAGDISRKFGEFHAGRGERVIAANGAVRQDEHERRRDVLASVLASLASRIAVERFGAADERIAIVLRTKRLDRKRSLGSARHRLQASGFAIAAHRVAQAVVDRFRIQ